MITMALLSPHLTSIWTTKLLRGARNLLQDMYEKTVSLLRQHHAALLKTMKVFYVLAAMPVPFKLSHFYICNCRFYFSLWC